FCSLYLISATEYYSALLPFPTRRSSDLCEVAPLVVYRYRLDEPGALQRGLVEAQSGARRGRGYGSFRLARRFRRSSTPRTDAQLVHRSCPCALGTRATLRPTDLRKHLGQALPYVLASKQVVNRREQNAGGAELERDPEDRQCFLGVPTAEM